MAKYTITRSGGPMYQAAREAPGLHIHVDASNQSGNCSIGIVADRRTPATATPTELDTYHTQVKTTNIHLAEAIALHYGVKVGVSRQQSTEHLFLYTDSKETVYALYGKGKPPTDDLHTIITKITDALPCPTRHSLILCDSAVNPAHDVSQGNERRRRRWDDSPSSPPTNPT